METTLATTPFPESSNGVPRQSNSKQKSQRYKKPNFDYIHRHQLPVEVYPLPPLIPHNPLSILAVALSYVVQLLRTPKQPTYNGYFSSATSSIHITNEESARALWEMGFFGKGSLSRSEPSWLARERKKGETSEEVTGHRRAERRQFKLERARKEQEGIADKLREERNPHTEGGTSHMRINSADIADIRSVIAQQADEATQETVRTLETAQAGATDDIVKQNGLPTPPSSASSTASPSPVHDISIIDTAPNLPPPQGAVAKRQVSNGAIKAVRFSPTIEAREFDLSSPVVSPLKHPGPSPLSQQSTEQITISKVEVEDQEHLELSLEEAFFLSYGLGVLKIFSDGSDVLLDSVSLLSLFRRHSYFPPHNLSIPLEPDDPFMMSYVVYHHFRSLGWVVRSGVKFSVDYLLYNRGPVFSHAEFAVVIVPAYTDPFWHESSLKRMTRKQKDRRTWQWLHGVNRVQAQVKKSLVLCYVDIPSPVYEGGKVEMDIGALLSRYKVREINVRRWTPNRSRD